jgi:hypothetical protein
MSASTSTPTKTPNQTNQNPTPFDLMNGLLKDLLGLSAVDTGYANPSIRTVFERTVNDMADAQTIIARWGAERRESDGDLYNAINMLSIIDLMSAFMFQTERIVGEEKATQIYKKAMEMSDTFYTSPSRRVTDEAEKIIYGDEPTQSTPIHRTTRAILTKNYKEII